MPFPDLPIIETDDAWGIQGNYIHMLVLKREPQVLFMFFYIENPLQLLMLGNEFLLAISSLANKPDLLAQITMLMPVDNKLGEQSPFVFFLLLNNLSLFHNAHSLSLAGNKLNLIPLNDLTFALSKIPPNIGVVDFSDNNLNEKTEEELNRLFKSLPVTVKCINVSKNDFLLEGKIKSALTGTEIETVILDGFSYFPKFRDYARVARRPTDSPTLASLTHATVFYRSKSDQSEQPGNTFTGMLDDFVKRM